MYKFKYHYLPIPREKIISISVEGIHKYLEQSESGVEQKTVVGGLAVGAVPGISLRGLKKAMIAGQKIDRVLTLRLGTGTDVEAILIFDLRDGMKDKAFNFFMLHLPNEYSPL